MTIAASLARFSCELSFDQIPDAVVRKTKHLMLDAVGISISSTRMPFGRSVLDLVSDWGGAEESTTIGRRQKVAVHNAAFCNGVLAHGQDYDDTHTASVVHPSAALFPVAIAVAEQVDASGRDMLCALIAGMESAIHLSMPVANRFHLRGFHTTSLTTTFAAALIAAKLNGMTFSQTVAALGTSGSFVSGLVECVAAGSEAKRLHAGWAGHCGIKAAELARAGFPGPASIFEGRFGVYPSMLRGETVESAEIGAALGKIWEVLNVRPKLYPCCHILQAHLDCAAAIRRDHGTAARQIKSIVCRIPEGAIDIVCEPWSKKLNPTTSYEARFSLPFAVSLMLAKGRAGTAEFSEQLLHDVDIRNLMAKTRYEVDPKYEPKDLPGYVEVILENGATFFCEIPVVRGTENNPVKPSEILAKFEANTAFLSQEARSDLSNAILKVDEFSNIHKLTEKFSFAN